MRVWKNPGNSGCAQEAHHNDRSGSYCSEWVDAGDQAFVAFNLVQIHDVSLKVDEETNETAV
jgi:hypothetical protein